MIPLRTIILLVACGCLLPLGAQKFRPDDPLRREPKSHPVAEVQKRDLSMYYDFFLHTFSRRGEGAGPSRRIPAGGVNTLDEVMDGAWYENRHGQTRMSVEQLVRGPGTSNPPSMDGFWAVTSLKTAGVTPGLEINDARGVHYWLKFDPLTNPGMASAADVLGSKFFYALGYHVPEYYLVTFGRDQLKLAAGAVLEDKQGKERPMTARDLAEVLVKAPRDADGRYRAGASLAISGTRKGPFQYYGTRPDDPNDIVPHEHRRDLRGLFVFAAWLGHNDIKALNTFDTLVKEDGLSYVKHYLIDFGASLGSDSFIAKSPRAGNQYLFSWAPSVVQFLTLGLYVPKWATAKYPDLPEVGRFESALFDPEEWKPNYPIPAFENRLPDDTFWAAKQVMAFTDDEIRAIVATGGYTDPRSTDWISKCLIERRDKIGRAYLERVLPLDRFEIRGVELWYEDLGVKYGLVPSRNISTQWSSFDNDTERRTAIPGGAGRTIPSDVISSSTGSYFAADLSAGDTGKSVTVYLRKEAEGLKVVGIDRKW